MIPNDEKHWTVTFPNGAVFYDYYTGQAAIFCSRKLARESLKCISADYPSEGPFRIECMAIDPHPKGGLA